MVGLLADSGELNLLSPTQLSTALTDAATDIQYGLEHLKKGELQTALATFFEHDANGPGPKDDVYYLDFKVTMDGSLVQEGSESLALNALNVALDGSEPGNEVFLYTFGNPSWYNLTFQPATKDLDIHSGHYIV